MIDYTITKHKWTDPDVPFDRLRRLTLGPTEDDSQMICMLNRWSKNPQKTRWGQTTLWLVHVNREVVGWAWLDTWLGHFEVFVEPRHRRYGIGTALFSLAQKDYPKSLLVYPHDPVSRGFFKAQPVAPCLMLGVH